jgi:transporter family-2 protein
MWYAFVFGLMLPFNIRMNESLSRVIGAIPATVAIHAAGGIVGAALLLPFAPAGWVQAAKGAPWWAWFGGILGLGMVILANRAVGMMGVASFLAVTVALQLISGAAIDHFGWVGSPVHALSLPRFAGIVLLAAGAFLVVRG